MKLWYRTCTLKPHMLKIFNAVDKTPRTVKELMKLTGMSKTLAVEAVEYLSSVGLINRRGHRDALYYRVR